MKINVHTHYPPLSQANLALVNQYPFTVDRELLHFSVGIHPWYINEKTLEEELNLLESSLQLANCLALGECGLDKKIDVPMALQEKVLGAQLVLAEKYKKAVILHVVSAYQEIVAIKKRLGLSVPLIIHGFNKKPQLAEHLIKQGFYLSFGGALLHSEYVRESFDQTPVERVFLETDDAENLTIEEVYQAASTIKPNLEQQLYQNFIDVFEDREKLNK